MSSRWRDRVVVQAVFVLVVSLVALGTPGSPLADSPANAQASPTPTVSLVTFGPIWTGDSWGLTEDFLTTTAGYLTDPTLFGPSGTAGFQFQITSVDSLDADALISALAGADVFFTGWVSTSDYEALSSETTPRTVKQILRDFVDGGGSLIATTDDTGHTLADAFGLTQQNGSGDPTTNTITNAGHPLASGPFGATSTFNQYFLTGSYSDESLNGAVVIGRQGSEGAGSPSVVAFEPSSLAPGSGPAVFVADIDVFSDQGGAEANAALIKNIFAYAATAATDLIPWSSPGYDYLQIGSEDVAPTGWEVPGFAEEWQTGAAGFGWTETPACALNQNATRTTWDIGTDLLVRHDFELPTGASSVRVQVAVDNDLIGIWVNGTLIKDFISHDNCPTRGDTGTFLVPASALSQGTNVIAARALDRGGSSYFDLRVFAEASPATLDAVELTTVAPTAKAGIDSIDIRDIPISLLTADTSPSSAPLSAIPLSAIDIADSPLSAIPLSAIPLSAIPLSAIKLSDVPLSAIGGWEQFLSGTSLEGLPLQAITLDQVPSTVLDQVSFGDAELASTAIGQTSLLDILFPGGGTTALSSPLSAIGLSASPLSAIPLSAIRIEGLPLSAIPLSAIPLSAIDLAGSPLSAIPLSAIDIAGSPLSAIPLSAIPLSAIGDLELCGTDPCSTVGIDRTTDSLIALANAMVTTYGSLAASPLSAIPLSAIDLSGVPLSAIPLSAIAPEASPLSAIPLSAIPLSAIPLSAIDASFGQLLLSDTYVCEAALVDCSTFSTLKDLLVAYDGVESSPLSAIPLSAIPLSAIPLSAIPLSAIPLSAVDLGTTPLSAIDVRNSPLSAIPLSAIPLSAIGTASSPLSAIPLSAIPLSAIDTVADCAGIDCTNTALTLGQIADAGALRAGATLGDIVAALSAYTLADLQAYGATTLQDFVNGLSLAYLYGNLAIGDGADFGDLALADLLALLIPIDDLPWQDVDPNGLQPIACEPEAFGDCASPTVDDITYEVSWTISGGTSTDPTDITVTLPDGFVYLEGLTGHDIDGLSVGDLSAGTVSGATVSWSGIESAPGTHTLRFHAAPGFDLGSMAATADVTLGSETLSGSAAVNITDRGEDLASNETVSDDAVYYRHLSPSADIDLFDVGIPSVPGSRVNVQIGQLSDNDADLVIFKPAGLPPTAFTPSSPLGGVPIADEAGTQSETIQDVPTDQGQVAGASTQRNTGSESATVVNDGTDLGFYTIQVERYNDGVTDPTAAASPLYSLLVGEDPPPIVPACAPLSLTGGSIGSAPLSLAGFDTLILVNQQRMQAAYGSAADTVMSRLGTLAARSDVNGVVYPVDSDSAVQTAYDGWDSNPCDPNLANGVVSAITEIIDHAVTASPGLRYIVVVGSDDIIPMWREADLTRLSNERDYAPTFDRSATGDRIGSLYGALVTGNILTDAAYADLNPIPFLSGHLFVEDLAIGRLVETPAEIITQIDTFETYNGTLDATTADYAVTGYDFLADGSQAVADALDANLGGTGTVDIDGYATTSGFWTAADLTAILNTGPDVASINAHYDHNRSLPSDQDAANTETDLFTVADVINLSASLDGSLLFTMGCHAGLNVSAVGVGSPDSRVSDWAQTYAAEGVTYVGNTGFGYGDTALVAYSERLMELFAQQLDGSRPAGEAFAIAKNLYYVELGMAAVYDAKVMMEATFYGLPMYGLGGGTPAGPVADPRVGAVVNEPVTGQSARTVILTDPVGTGFTRETSEAGGSYYTLDGAVTVHDRPIQPLSIIELPPAPDGSSPRGAIIETLANTDMTGFEVAIGHPVIDLTSTEQPIVPGDAFFPTRLQNIACSTVLDEELCRLTLIRGQFRSETGNVGTQRLFTDVEATVYYADPGEPDVTPPTFSRVEVSQVGTDGFGVSAHVTDDSPATVTRAMCLYRLPSAAVWNALELVDGGSGVWTGGASAGSATASEIEVFCQAVDHAGNVGVTTFKGLNYSPAPPPPATTGVTLSGTMGNNGWYTTPVDVLVGGNVFTTVTGDGIHTVPVGDSGSVLVPIDTTTPVVNPKVDGAVYIVGLTVTDPACADAGSGLETCNHTVDTSTPGTWTISVSATDRAGNGATLSLTYHVVTTPLIDLTPAVVAIDAAVSASSPITELAGTVATWDWGDGSSSSAMIEAGAATGSHTYTSPGVYTVTLTVDHAGRLTQQAQYEFAVVYDPEGGFVTGGGWIDSPAGAYTADESLTGKASFGFVSKYKKGKTVPEGNTQFQFKAGNLKFKSTAYDWLVIAGKRAQFQGEGTINGKNDANGDPYRFFLVGIDGDAKGAAGTDKFRIRIWGENGIIYDNKINSPADSDDATDIGGGSIVIHSGK